MMRFCTEQGLLEIDPSLGIKVKVPKTDGHRTWTQAEIDQFEARHPIGTMPRLAIALAQYFGQRRSDLHRIGRAHIRDGELVLKQIKGGEAASTVHVTLHPALLEAIAAMPT